jgi:hypothetical protein
MVGYNEGKPILRYGSRKRLMTLIVCAKWPELGAISLKSRGETRELPLAWASNKFDDKSALGARTVPSRRWRTTRLSQSRRDNTLSYTPRHGLLAGRGPQLCPDAVEMELRGTSRDVEP